MTMKALGKSTTALCTFWLKKKTFLFGSPIGGKLNLNKWANLDPKFPIFILLVTNDVVDAGDLGAWIFEDGGGVPRGDIELGVADPGGGWEVGGGGGLDLGGGGREIDFCMVNLVLFFFYVSKATAM